MAEVHLEKLIDYIDEKKVEELKRFLDAIPLLDDLAYRLNDLKADGSLDALLNFAEMPKVIKDVLNDDAIENIGKAISSVLELGEMLNDPEVSASLREIAYNLDAMADLTKALKQLKDDGTLNALIDSAYALKALKDMLNTEAVENLSKAISSILDLSQLLQEDGLNEMLRELTSSGRELSYAITKLRGMVEDGTLDVLINLGYGIRSLKDMLNDEALAAISKYLSSFLEAYPKFMEIAEVMLSEVPMRLAYAISSEETRKAVSEAPRIGLYGLLKALQDPYVQKGLGVMVTLLKQIGKSFS